MKLYSHKQAPNPRRVRIFLAEKGMSVPTEEVDIFARANRQPPFLHDTIEDTETSPAESGLTR